MAPERGEEAHGRLWPAVRGEHAHRPRHVRGVRATGIRLHAREEAQGLVDRAGLDEALRDRSGDPCEPAVSSPDVSQGELEERHRPVGIAPVEEALRRLPEVHDERRVRIGVVDPADLVEAAVGAELLGERDRQAAEDVVVPGPGGVRVGEDHPRVVVSLRRYRCGQGVLERREDRVERPRPVDVRHLRELSPLDERLRDRRARLSEGRGVPGVALVARREYPQALLGGFRGELHDGPGERRGEFGARAGVGNLEQVLRPSLVGEALRGGDRGRLHPRPAPVGADQRHDLPRRREPLRGHERLSEAGELPPPGRARRLPDVRRRAPRSPGQVLDRAGRLVRSIEPRVAEGLAQLRLDCDPGERDGVGDRSVPA